MRVGLGYDVHQLVEGRPLILGGVTIPYEKGLLGHSDADVLAHAITDALLGALNLGSLGDHFPDTDPHYKDADSLKLLQAVIEMMGERGYDIENIDSVVVAQEPKLKPHIAEIQTSLAAAMNVSTDIVSIKATTTERLGFEGRKEGISSHAVVLLKPRG